MRHIPMLVAALAFLPSAAMAQDGAGYVGLEGGLSFAHHTDYDVAATRVQTVPTGNGLLGQTVTTTNTRYGNGLVAGQKTGADVDAIAGYDFGVFRVEAELGYKRSRLRSVTPSGFLLGDTNTAPISGVTSGDFRSGKHTSVFSGMIDALVDYDLKPGLRLYGGAGAGRARVKSLGDRDDAWAFQLIAGASTAITPHIELGLKYRYFQTGHVHFDGNASFSDAATGSTSMSQFVERGRFRSNSLLASIAYNFGEPSTK